MEGAFTRLLSIINAYENTSFVFLNKKRLPTSKAMEKARLQTFGENLWPHDEQDDHGASSKKVRPHAHLCRTLNLIHYL
jgi:hypothetical protein